MDPGKSETTLKEQQLKVSGFEANKPSNGREAFLFGQCFSRFDQREVHLSLCLIAYPGRQSMCTS